MSDVVKNACSCSLCGASADKYPWGYQCTAVAGHIADPYIGMWSDLTRPPKTDSDPIKEQQ